MQYMQRPRWQVHNTSIKHLLLVLIIILGGQTVAQNVTFKKRIDNGLDNRGTGLIEVDSSYIILGWGYSMIDPTIYIKIYKTDFTGNVIAFREYGESNTFWETGIGSVFKANDGSYVFGGTRRYLNRDEGLIVKFDLNLDTLWTNSVPSSSHIFFYQGREALDGGFVFIGSSDENDPNANYLLLKTDSLGNELWRKEYGGIYRDIGRNIEVTLDGGYILSGDRFQDASMNSRIGYLVKTDSVGNIEWDKYFGTSGNDGLFFVNTINSNGYLIWGNIDTLGSSTPIAFLAKIDDSGNIIWRTVFTQYNRAFILQSRQLSNNTILSAGEIRNDSLFGPIAWIVKHDENGNKLWERFYYWNKDSMLGMAINDFIETSDGGILATGFAYKTESNGISRSQFLLMKLDSNGCLVNDCGLFTGIEEYVPQQTLQARIYPNPTTGTLTIELPNGQGGSMALYNLLGQSVYQTTLAGGQTTLALNLPPGLYLYRIGSGGKAVNGKLLVE